MSDTTNPTASPTAVQRRPRIKDALAIGATSIIESGCQGLNAAAKLMNGMATRVTLYNASVYLDLVEDQNGNETVVANAIDKVKSI